MQSAFHRTVRAWDGSYYVPRISAEQAGQVGPFATQCLLALGFLYCGTVAYDVVQSLREVKLIELRAILYRVSVGDAILTWLAYVVGRDLLRVALQRDRL